MATTAEYPNYTITLPRSSELHHPKRKQVWKDSGLDHQVIQNLVRINQIPDELSKRIIRCIIQAHHLEVVVPPGSKTTRAVDASLISFIATSVKSNKPPASLEAPATHTSPTVLVICLSTKKVEAHCKMCRELGDEVEGIQVNEIHHSNSLSTELAELRCISTNRPILITTLSRLTLLLYEHRVISIDKLSILVLDLRDRRSNSLNHHLLAELEPLLDHLKPHVQIVVLHHLEAPIPVALSELLSHKMETSIRANLGSTNSAAPSDPTPSLTSASISPTPSNSLCPYTPPVNLLSQDVVTIPSVDKNF